MNITKKLKTKITKPKKTAKPKKKTGEIRMPRGRALMLRTCAAGMLAHGGFVWPTSGEVKAHDWKADKVCDFGLHGLLWGRGDWGLLSYDPTAIWVVVEIIASEAVDLADKIKVPRGWVVFTGKREDAIEYIAKRLPAKLRPKSITASGVRGQATASGVRGQATASGVRGQATASGYAGQATASGYAGQATASGYAGQATASGVRGQATASGDAGQATASGKEGEALAGRDGEAVAGPNGWIAIVWFDGERRRLAVGYVGEDGIKPLTRYRCDAGKFVEIGPWVAGGAK